MFRRGSRAAVAAAALVCVASAAAQASRASTNATRPEIETFSLPVQDLDLPIASLDETVVATARRVTLQADVLFAFGSSTLGDRSRSRVEAAASELRTRRPGGIRVIGHTDSRGSARDVRWRPRWGPTRPRFAPKGVESPSLPQATPRTAPTIRADELATGASRSSSIDVAADGASPGVPVRDCAGPALSERDDEVTQRDLA